MGESPSLLTASELRQLCQTMGEPYAHLIAELDKADVVELSVAYGKVQTFTSESIWTVICNIIEKIWKFQQYVMSNKKKAKLSRLLRMSVRKART